MEPCFPGDGWTPACPWEVVNEFLVLLCLHARLLLYLLNCSYLNPWVLHSFPILPPSLWVRGSEQLRGAWLPAGIKPQQSFLVAGAGRWPGHHCCFCAAVLDRLELQCELESKGLWPVDESTWEQDTLKHKWPNKSMPKQVYLGASVAMVMSVPQQVCLWRNCGPRESPCWRRYTSKHLWLWISPCYSRYTLKHQWLCMMSWISPQQSRYTPGGITARDKAILEYIYCWRDCGCG